MAKNVYRQGKKSVSISQSGALNIKLGPVRLTGSKLEVKLESGRAIFPLRGVQLSPPMPNDYLPGGGTRLIARSQHSGLEITVNLVLPAEGLGMGISVEIQNLQRAVIPLQSVTLLRLLLRKINPIGTAPKPYMLVDSGHSSGDTGLHALSGEPADDEIAADEGRAVTAMFVPGGSCVVAGCILGGRTLAECKIHRDQLVITADINCEIPPHGYFGTDLLVLQSGEDLNEALMQFGAAHKSRKRAVEASAYHAWTSCDWYGDELSESDVMDNLEFVKETPWLRDNLKYVIVGRGWQRALGDWEPNDRFPSLMDTVATRINDAGFSPGIWAAPLAGAAGSTLAEEHPEWILKKADRRAEETGLLDFTQPAVRDHVFAMFRKFHDWGYRYFRTDFAGCAVEPSSYRYRGRGASVQDGLRSTMTAIRAAIGEESFWVSTDVPLSLAAGLCDGVAVTGPARPFYSTLIGCARSAMYRSHLHGLLWLNDPGFLVTRGADTAHPEGLRPGDNAGGSYERYGWEKGPMLRLNEAKLWATWIIISGGILTIGDRLASLKAEGLDVVRKALLRAGSTSATPLDLGVVPLPRIWQRVEGQTATLAVFNWSDGESEIVVTPQQGALLPEGGELFEVWKDETVEMGGDILRRRLPPHSCELFEWDLV